MASLVRDTASIWPHGHTTKPCCPLFIHGARRTHQWHSTGRKRTWASLRCLALTKFGRFSLAEDVSGARGRDRLRRAEEVFFSFKAAATHHLWVPRDLGERGPTVLLSRAA